MPETTRQAPLVLKESHQINDLRAFLQGEWRLERSIADGRSGIPGSLTGLASFAPRADGLGYGLDYREEGLLTLGDHCGAAHQAYRYDFVSPGCAAVNFTDGRYFHDLDLTAGIWRCRHLCGDDRYDGVFTALGAANWRVVWSVAGPRKDLRLDTTYRRAL